jgi:hypothetical protein
MREDIMYVIVYPDGLIVMNTQKYYRRFCIKEWCEGCSRTWKQWYKIKKFNETDAKKHYGYKFIFGL